MFPSMTIQKYLEKDMLKKNFNTKANKNLNLLAVWSILFIKNNKIKSHTFFSSVFIISINFSNVSQKLKNGFKYVRR